MHALVTGGTGFVGANVVRALLARGHRVRCLARAGTDARNLHGLDVEHAEGDLLDEGSLRAALEGVDTLFHVAALYALWTKEPRRLYDVNVEGTKTLLALAMEAGVEDVVYTSSVAVLRPPAAGAPPSTEDAEPALEEIVGDYKRSKALAEREVKRFVQERGLRAFIVLPSAPIGPWDRKPTPTGQMVVDFLNKKMPGYVDTGLNLVAVEDVAEAHLLALERGTPGRRYILGGENLTLREILATLAELTGRPEPKIRVPYAVAYALGAASTGLARLTGRPPGIPLDGVRMARKRMWFDPTRARDELGLGRTSAREALRRAAVWFCEHGLVRADRAPALLEALRAHEPADAAPAGA